MGETAAAETDLTWMIGPSFSESFAALGIADVEGAIAEYRTAYLGGAMFDAAPYEGVEDMLSALRAAGHVLYLATAKPHAYAKRITAHFGLSRFLAREYGPELDGTRSHKGDLLAHALAETGERPDAAIMVGDRLHDMAAARQVGMRALAATWGYGTDAEWDGAAARVESPAALATTVARLTG